MAVLDLPEPYRRKLLALLDALVPDVEVWAYGSRTTGRSHATSDLDLVLRHPSDPKRAVPRLWAVREALAESDLPIVVEVLDWARIPESFHREIERHHVVLRAAGG